MSDFIDSSFPRSVWERGSYIALAVCLIVAGGCRRHEPPPATAENPTVTVVSPIRQSIRRTIRQPGCAKAYEQTPIYSRVAGYVESVPVDIGDQIKEGQLLARVQVPELEKDLNAKVARVGQAEAQVQQARRT